MSQVEKDTTVRSVYLFTKKHRPNLTINDDGIAIEIKYPSGSLDGLKQAIPLASASSIESVPRRDERVRHCREVQGHLFQGCQRRRETWKRSSKTSAPT